MFTWRIFPFLISILLNCQRRRFSTQIEYTPFWEEEEEEDEETMSTNFAGSPLREVHVLRL